LLGRETDLVALHQLLENPEARLLTLLGPGGIGKTRLAIEGAAQAQAQFPAGTFFLNLSTTDLPELVLPSIARAVGLPDAADHDLQLGRRLPRGRALLLVDTFEHLLAVAPAIGEVLALNPTLTVLVTSRAPLHLRGEREIPVGPLTTTPSEAGVAPAPAVLLFLERAAAVVPDFDPGPSGQEVVAEICARLDGLPLAIELAAARVKHMTLGDLRHQLEHRLDSLVGGSRDLPRRQQTMRGAFDWSYALLGATEMRLFRRLAAFRGSFGFDALGSIIAEIDEVAEVDVMPALSAVVDFSLVLVEKGSAGRARYRLLDVTRDYAVERSVAAGEFEALGRRHAEFYMALAERAEPALRGAGQRQLYASLLEDEGNLRAALSWALAVGEGEIALRLAGSLWMFWRWAGLFAEGRAWLEQALAAADPGPRPARHQGLWGAGWLAYHQGEYRRTDEAGREMLRLLRGEEDALEHRNALTLIGNAALAEGRRDDAVTALSEALAIGERLGRSWHLATSLLNLGTALRHYGIPAEARPLLGRALQLYTDLGDRHFTARALIQLGYADLGLGDSRSAGEQIQSAMKIAADLGDGWGIAEGLEGVATVRSEFDPHPAAQLWGAAEVLRERISMRAHPADAATTTAYIESARIQLGVHEFDDEWAEGRAMPMDVAVTLALE
jgi:predicted ATPase